MKKFRELSDPESCLNRARDNEIIFVLLARDAAAPAAIRAWAGERMRLGKNRLSDPQILEALSCADAMEAHYRKDTLPPVVAKQKMLCWVCWVCASHEGFEPSGRPTIWGECEACGRQAEVQRFKVTSTVNSESPDSEKEKGGAE
jgi:hypothetical protein